MTKMVAAAGSVSFAILCLILPLSGCSEAEELIDSGGESAAVAQAEASGGDSEAVAEASTANGARAVAEQNDVWDFAYSYPAAVGHIPQLSAMLDAQLEAEKERLKEEAITARAEADAEGYPYHAHALEKTWEVVTDIPGWLSLSAGIYMYGGGAHPVSGFDSLLWDRGEEVAREPMSLFTSAAALDAAIAAPFCATLNRQRAERRGSPVPANSDDSFDLCPNVEDMTVILGSTNNRTFDRIGFLIGPYVAGPYVEGEYEVTLPVTKEIKAAVKPEFAKSFTVVG